MRIKSLLLAIMMLCGVAVFAAPFQNVEKILTQPDGTKLYCLASGDEFYSRLHDANGFTIVQADNGYFVYATADSKGAIIPTAHIAGIADPITLGLKPNIMISQEEYQKRRKMMEVPEVRDAKNLNHGVYNNIVVFIKFKGDGEFKTTKTEIDSMFNYDGYYDISMNNYFKKATYNQLSMKSYCYPEADGDRLLAYEDIYPKNYYQPYNPTTNPEGYTNQAEREFPLLKRAIEYIADQVPADLDIDRNNDGYIDNVIFVVKGNVGDWSDLLWPHMWSMYGEEAYINGKRVGTFNFQLETSSYFSVSTLCHEMSHSLGFPDLYHYNSSTDHLSPAGPWDLMCGNANPPQHSSTYMKYKYGTWVDKIPEITEYGTYTLEANSWEGGRRNCFKIQSPHPDQYYFLEYRNKSNFFEKGIPSGGLLISRIDTRFRGCADHNGHDTFDEVYIFRPGGSYNINGTINGAAFSKDLGRTTFNCETDSYPFLNKNTLDLEFNICNVSEMGDRITFTYCPINIEIVPQNLTVNIDQYNSIVELNWNMVENADSYNIYRNNELVANVTDNHFNDEYNNFNSGYHKYHVTAQCGNEESFRSNEEFVITGEYSEYTINMFSSGENGWQGGEIEVSFDNEMDNLYYTIYDGIETEHKILVPNGVMMSFSWLKGWDDSECSFVISNNKETIYTSSVLEEGKFLEITASDSEACIAPHNLTVDLNDMGANLSWMVKVETEQFMILRNDIVIAENIKENYYVDNEIPESGSYTYSVRSMSDNCTSPSSNECTIFVLKKSYDSIDATASVVDNFVVLNWEKPSANACMKYTDDEYITSIGSASYNWGVKFPAESLKQFAGAKLSSLEIFDACETKYTFKIYNGANTHDSTMIYNGELFTSNTMEYVRLVLDEEISLDVNKDLWITAKATKNNAIPCTIFAENHNCNLIKNGTSWLSASDYNMDYSWMLKAFVSCDDSETELTYNIYKEEEQIASGLTTPTFTTEAEAGSTICYTVKAYLNASLVSESDTICVTTPEGTDPFNIIFPNPFHDYLNVMIKDIVNVKIFSSTGALILNKDTQDKSLCIDLRALANGVYILSITTKNEVITEKIIKY